jgi:hypothetical protein
MRTLACPAGVEPATYGLEGRCSIQLSYGQILAGSISELNRENGRSTRIRTLDPLLPKQVRYQAALHSDGIDILHRQGYFRQILLNFALRCTFLLTPPLRIGSGQTFYSVVAMAPKQVNNGPEINIASLCRVSAVPLFMQ